VAAAVQRAKAAMIPPNASILVGCLDSVAVAERRFVVGGIAFEASPAIDLVRLKPGAIVRVIYEAGGTPGTHRALQIRPLGLPR
jgi:hypothetical protein